MDTGSVGPIVTAVGMSTGSLQFFKTDGSESMPVTRRLARRLRALGLLRLTLVAYPADVTQRE